jgi:hypothetical protein
MHFVRSSLEFSAATERSCITVQNCGLCERQFQERWTWTGVASYMSARGFTHAMHRFIMNSAVP